jgi:hypothetical protein
VGQSSVGQTDGKLAAKTVEHWPPQTVLIRCRVALATLWFPLWMAVGAFSAQAAHASIPPTQAAPNLFSGAAAIDFRCDGLTVSSQPNKHVCKRNVLLRRGDILVCCQYFEGEADADWAWQRFVCRGDVRAWHAAETVWADRAEFVMASGDVTLSGTPLLARQGSLLAGDRIIFAVKGGQARVVQPRGQVVQGAAMTSTDLTRLEAPAPLPARCPIPPRPPRPGHGT